MIVVDSYCIIINTMSLLLYPKSASLRKRLCGRITGDKRLRGINFSYCSLRANGKVQFDFASEHRARVQYCAKFAPAQALHARSASAIAIALRWA